MARNILQIYTDNASTTLNPNDLLYTGKSPYSTTNDSAIKYSDLFAQFYSGGTYTGQVIFQDPNGAGSYSGSPPPNTQLIVLGALNGTPTNAVYSHIVLANTRNLASIYSWIGSGYATSGATPYGVLGYTAGGSNIAAYQWFPNGAGTLLLHNWSWGGGAMQLYNNGTLQGIANLNTTALTVNNFSYSPGGAFTSAGSITFSGAFSFTATLTANTNVTFPTSGTLLNNSLASANILIGNASNVATAVAVSGDGTLSNTGVLTVTKSNGVAIATKLAQVTSTTQALGTLAVNTEYFWTPTISAPPASAALPTTGTIGDRIVVNIFTIRASTQDYAISSGTGQTITMGGVSTSAGGNLTFGVVGPSQIVFEYVANASWQIVSTNLASYNSSGASFISLSGTSANLVGLYNIAYTNVRNTFTVAQGAGLQTLTYASSIPWTPGTTQQASTVTLQGNATLTMGNGIVPPAGFTCLLYVIQDGTGGWTLTLDTTYFDTVGTFALPGTAANAKNLITCVSNGTKLSAIVNGPFA